MIFKDTIFRLFWLLTFLALWIVSFAIIHMSVAHTQMGYKYHLLLSKALHLEEQSVQLKSEVSALHDLRKASAYAQTNKMVKSNPEKIEYVFRRLN